MREAEEEAGLLGIVARRPVGRYVRVTGDRRARVDVYLMRVTTVLEHWLEDEFRRRRWMRVPDAAARLRRELQDFVHGLEAAVELES